MAAKESAWVQWDEENSCWRDVAGNRVEPPTGSVRSEINHAELGAIFNATEGGRDPDFQKAIGALIKYQRRDLRSGTAETILATFLARVLAAYETAVSQRDVQRARMAPEDGVETNYAFHVDGYSLASTGSEDKIILRRYDGQSCVLDAKGLTSYFERRFEQGSRPGKGVSC